MTEGYCRDTLPGNPSMGVSKYVSITVRTMWYNVVAILIDREHLVSDIAICDIEENYSISELVSDTKQALYLDSE